MQALLFKAVGEAAVEDIPEPRAKADEVVVAVASTGICHTDSDILHGRYMGAYPVVPGHEIAGTVIAVGSDVHDVAVGARVAVDPLLPCGTCPACQAGRPSLCENLRGYGATSNGGFAPRMAVRARNVHPIGDMPFHVAALAEPFACVMHGIDRAHVAPEMRALVFGAGPIGLMMMMGLQTRGVENVTMVDLEDTRLERARSLGATSTLSAKGLEPSGVPAKYDLVIDCTGVPAVCERMPAFARDGATLMFFGVCPPDSKVAISPYEVFRRELTIVGSHSLSNNLPDALAALRSLGERAEALVSDRLPLERILTQIRTPAKTGTMKVQYQAEA